MSRLTTSGTAGTVGHPIVAAMRLALAASALGILFIDPSQPDRFALGTSITLGLYSLYSATVWGLTLRRPRAAAGVDRWAHWIDIAWYALLIALSNGTSSIFYFGFFFAILVASFRWGFRSGLRVTVASVLLFSAIGLAMAPAGVGFELNRALVRPMYTLVLGYMMAYWGGNEIALKRRLELLREVSTLSNPRFGVDRTVGALLERIRAFYDADACLMISGDPAGAGHVLRRAGRGDRESASRPTTLPPELASRLLAVPPAQALIFRRRSLPWGARGAAHAVDISTGKPLPADTMMAAALAATLDTDALLTVPLPDHDTIGGRIFLAGSRAAFDLAHADLLLQVFEQVTPVIENIRLVDRLASDAAEQERQRIARDLHDSVIQPYIGLQLGLAALQRKQRQHLDLDADIERLGTLTADGIAELRGYVSALKVGGEHRGNLQGAIERFAAKFGAATGIDVAVHAASDVHCNDRLGAELFQMVAEGLSNVRRHTEAKRATIALARADNSLVLRVENEAATMPGRFMPRSIAERATALGGAAYVEQRGTRGTAVVINSPL